MNAERPGLRALGEQLAREEDEYLARHPGPPLLRVAPRRTTRKTAWVLAAAAAIALVAAGGAALLRPRALEVTVGGEAAVPGSWIAAPVDSAVQIRFSDGTDVQLASGGHARLAEVTAHGAHVMLEEGSATLSVTPRPRAHWTVSAGPYNVEVKGTRFEVGWSPGDEVFTLKLTEGSVAISGCTLGPARPMFAGETLRASCRDRDFQITRAAMGPAQMSPAPSASVAMGAIAAAMSAGAAMPAAPAPKDADPAHPSSRSATAHPTTAGSASWQALARASRFREAFELARDNGFEAELDRASVQDLLLLGDAARLSGNAPYALRAYQRARSRAPGTPWAANAAFSLGRVYFDQLDSFGEAARWFATYSSEAPSGPLAREALGRRMEALSRGGDRSGAARVAEQYLRQYPSGPHAPLARTLETEEN